MDKVLKMGKTQKEIIERNKFEGERRERAIERHLNTKLTITVESFRDLFEYFTDNQRIEVIKSLVWTSPDNERFLAKVTALLTSEKFKRTID